MLQKYHLFDTVTYAAYSSQYRWQQSSDILILVYVVVMSASRHGCSVIKTVPQHLIYAFCVPYATLEERDH